MKKYMLILAMSLMACGASDGIETDADVSDDADLDVASDVVTDTSEDAVSDASDDVKSDAIVDAGADAKDCGTDAHICHKHHCHH